MVLWKVPVHLHPGPSIHCTSLFFVILAKDAKLKGNFRITIRITHILNSINCFFVVFFF